MTLGEFYDKIESWPSDTMNFRIEGVFSWRGFYVEPPYDEFLEEMKQYLYDDLEFYKNSQSRFYPEENTDIADIYGNINNYYLDEESIRKVLRYIKDNNLAKKQ